MRSCLLFVLVFAAQACCLPDRKPETDTPSPTSDPAKPGQTAQNKKPSAPDANIPADGKYENVSVEGKVVPLIEIMNNGDVVLVDTDNVKPRTWEQQYKRKGDLPRGTYNIHKTDVNKNNSFEDDPVDRQGQWTMDTKGNIK